MKSDFPENAAMGWTLDHSSIQQFDVDFSHGKHFNMSLRNIKSGFLQSDLDSFSGQSLDGGLRKSSSGPYFSRSLSGLSTSSKFTSSRRVSKALKDCARKLVNLELFMQNLGDWALQKSHADSINKEYSFRPPFSLDEMRELDLALEGVLFQQLLRMPCLPSSSDDYKEEEYFAIEDFLHVIVVGLWRTFWHKSGPLPFFLSSCLSGSKFYTLQKAISKGRVNELCGLALMSRTGTDTHARWDQVVEFALFRPDILSGNELKLSSSSICEALFYGVRILIARTLSKSNAYGGSSVFVLVFDSKFGGVVKISGDIFKLELNSTNPYHSMTEWIKCHADVEVSSVDRVWNKLGNGNWGDVGTLQVLLATFYSMVQWSGLPKRSISSLASNHMLLLQNRRMESRLAQSEKALVPFQQMAHKGEVIELGQGDNPSFEKQALRLKLQQGQILLLDDPQQGHKGFQIQDSFIGGNYFHYTAVSLDYPTELLTLYMGAHPSRLEPSWEDMSLWYQVQRQTKVLNILKQQGITSKYLPEIVASGQILHPGPCSKQSPGALCDHPLCGTPILVTCPVGEPLSFIVARDGSFSSEEATRCCRDCLAALRSAAMANVQHGDICPENIIHVVDPQVGTSRYVPICWGRAVLEDRDSSSINLRFSSSHALQHAKLCPSSDAESLIYLLFFICGGTVQQQESIESALQWREKSWAKRQIQQQLGEVSPLLKAFADYIDSLCGTPYPLDYDIWLKRLNTAVDGSADKGKMIEEAATKLRLEYVAKSSGTSSSGV